MSTEKQIPIDPSARADDQEIDELRDDGTHEVTGDLAYKRLAIVNVVLCAPGRVSVSERYSVVSTAGSVSRGRVDGTAFGVVSSRPVNVADRLQSLPDDGMIPEMPGWTWLHTPGHTPGHVSFWRPSDRCIISGDCSAQVR